MKNVAIAAAVAFGLGIGSLAGVEAKLPAPPALSDADKAAKAAKDASSKAAAADQLSKAQDKAAANYKKNKGVAMDGKPAPAQKASTKK